MSATIHSNQTRATTGERLAAYGATAALVSGVVAVLGTVFLFATFATEASTLGGASTEMSALDRLANGLMGLSMLVAIPIALRLHQGWRNQAPGASAATLAVGVVSLPAYGLLLLALGAGAFASAADIGGASVIPLGGIGVWLILVSVGPADVALSGLMRWLGVAIGVGLVFLPIGFFFGGGAAAAANPKLAFESPLLIVTAVVSLLASQIGYPIWAIWLSRRWRAGGIGGEVSRQAST